jgi:hypothetical protein
MTKLPETVTINREMLSMLDPETREWAEAQLSGVVGSIKAAVEGSVRHDDTLERNHPNRGSFKSVSIGGVDVSGFWT